MALQFGMPHNVYWYSEPDLLECYARSFVNMQKAELQSKDWMAWCEGQYVQTAMAIVLTSAFGKTPPDYPSEPVFAKQFDENAKEKAREKNIELSRANFLAAIKGEVVKENAAS